MSALLAALFAFVAAAVPAGARTVPKGATWYETYQLPKAWQVSEGKGVTVAVVDDGVKTSIGDLQGQTVAGKDYTGDDPGADQDDAKSAGYGHGTDMAVKIAGSGQGGGMVGVAPQAKIMPMDAGTASGIDPGDAAQAIRDAVERGAKVINLSFGSVASCEPGEAAAIKFAYQHGVIVVAAAGDAPGAVSNPANCPGALAIGGVDAAGKPWTQTPSGPEIAFVSLAYNLVNEQLNGTLGGPYPENSGTSSSAAFVSGMFALLISHFPHDSARQIVTRALYAVHNGLGAGHLAQRVDNTLGYGELLPYFALTQKLPANAKNPIFDQFDKQLGLTAAGGSSTPTNSTAPGSASNTPGTTTSKSGSSSSSPAVAIIVTVGVVVVIGAGIFFLRRSRRPNHRGPNGPGGPYYPPPPPPGY